MRVLVTGANGFIGANLCAALAARADCAVRALVRPGSDRRLLANVAPLEVEEGDITIPATLAAAFAGIELVYHLAGRVADWGPWAQFRALNIGGTRNVLAAARAAGVQRVVHVSSVSVYGFAGGRDLDEATPFLPRPDDPYVSTKAAAERLALAANSRGLEVVVVRPGAVYGRFDHTTTLKLVPLLLSRRFALVDGGAHLLSPAYIDNLTQLLALAGEAPNAAGEAFNAADAGYTSWRQFLGWMCEDLGVSPPRLSVPRALAWPAAVAVEAFAKAAGKATSPPITKFRLRAVAEDQHYSIEKARRLLGYEPEVETREGVRRTIAWYREQKR